jgi:hypothetical protein
VVNIIQKSVGIMPMQDIRSMIAAHPDVRGNLNEALAECVSECFSCTQICLSCADACLAEEMVEELRQCIRLDLDCADICAATGKLALRRAGGNEQSIMSMLRTCEDICRRCAEECARHAEMHEHCRICAESCRACAEACVRAAGTLRR